METGGLRPSLSALPTLWAMQVAPWPPEPQCPHLPVAAELKELYVGLGQGRGGSGAGSGCPALAHQAAGEPHSSGHGYGF